jgi:prepilin-type N-terminal cleavage/methylation domain-containing protein
MRSLPVSSTSNSNHDAGFSLVELSVVLVIMGVLLSLSLPLLSSQSIKSATLRTQGHKEQVEKALKSYWSHTNTLPCPAPPQAQGVAPKTCRGASAIGVIPYKTLGIPEQMAKDGHRRYFTYAVESKLTKPPVDGDHNKTMGGSVVVLDSYGKDAIDSKDKSNYVVYVMISHGESGAGSFMPSGSRTVSDDPEIRQNPEKQKNADSTLTFQYGRSEDQVIWQSSYMFIDVKPTEKTPPQPAGVEITGGGV